MNINSINTTSSKFVKVATIIGASTSSALLPFSVPKNEGGFNTKRAERISNSFVSKVFAETSIYGPGCFFPNFFSSPINSCDPAPPTTSICTIEGDITTIPLFIKTTPEWEISQTNVQDNAPFLLNPNPTSQVFPPATRDTKFSTSFTAPAVSASDNFKNGKLYFSTYFISQSGPESADRNLDVRVEHRIVKSKLNYTNLSADFQQQLSDGKSSLDIPTSVTFTSTGNYPLSVLFELSNDNSFGTILQSHTFTNSPPNTPLSYSFRSLSPGTYYWRARAQEIGAPRQCTGFANADPSITLTSTKPFIKLLASAPKLIGTATLTPTPIATSTPSLQASESPQILPRTGNSLLSFIFLLLLTGFTSTLWILRPFKKRHK